MEASDRVRSFSWASRLPVCCMDQKNPCCCGDAGTVHRWTGWWEALCQAKQVTLEAWFAGTFYYLGKGLGDILTRGGHTDEHWSSGS